MAGGRELGPWSKGEVRVGLGLFSEEAYVGLGTDSMLGWGDRERSSK